MTSLHPGPAPAQDADAPAGEVRLSRDNAEARGTADGLSVRLTNNTWNVGDRRNGTDFTQTITYSPADLARDVVIAWDFGAAEPTGVLSYPNIAFGESPWNRDDTADLSTRIDDLRALDVTVDASIAGQTDSFDVAFDIWLTDTPLGESGTITTEVMIWLHTPEDSVWLPVAATWKSGDTTAKVYVADDFEVIPGQTWRYIAVLYDTPQLRGTVDIDGLFRFLAAKGLIDGQDYISGVELGAEVMGNAGSLTLHSVRMKYETAKLHTGD